MIAQLILADITPYAETCCFCFPKTPLPQKMVVRNISQLQKTRNIYNHLLIENYSRGLKIEENPICELPCLLKLMVTYYSSFYGGSQLHFSTLHNECSTFFQQVTQSFSQTDLCTRAGHFFSLVVFNRLAVVT